MTNDASLIICWLLESDEDDDFDAKDITGPLDPAEQLAYDQQILRDQILGGKFRESQYVDDYLRTNERFGDGHGYTIGTYLAYTLRGKAKSYSGHYASALSRALERRVKAGLAWEGHSRRGRTAYYPTRPQQF